MRAICAEHGGCVAATLPAEVATCEILRSITQVFVAWSNVVEGRRWQTMCKLWWAAAVVQ